MMNVTLLHFDQAREHVAVGCMTVV